MAEWIDVGPHIVSGVIDNTEKGKTLAELVIDGIDGPVLLELHGNARPDLAGCILKFTCPRSWPVEPEMREVLPKQRLIGNAGVISAAEKRETYTEEGERPIAAVLCFEWYDFATLTRFVFERADCKLDIDLPAWTLSEDEVGLQDEELKATAETFEGMWEEFEEDRLDQEIFEDQEAKLEAIMPELEAANTDDEKLKLMRAALGPDVDEYEVDGWFDVYFGPDDSEVEAFSPPKREPVELIVVDEEIKAANGRLADGAQLLRYRVEKEGDPGGVSRLAESLLFATTSIRSSGLFDEVGDGKHRIEPYSILEMMGRKLVECESVIQSLELEARQKEKALYSDSIWELRKAVSELIAVLDERKPDEPPPPNEEDNDLPF
jgi:hypothetical protein